MTMPLQVSVQDYRVLKARLLQDMPELADDPECLLDTLEGITDTKEQLAALLRSAVHEEALANGLDEYLKKLTDRKASLRDRAKRKRMIALNIMTDIGMKTITAPDMTVSVRNVPPSVVIIDETIIPDTYMRIKKEPNKLLLKDALAFGPIPGCEMSNGSQTLAIKL